MRGILRGLGAILVFLVVDIAINAVVFLLALLVNWNASGLTAWLIPFWARGVASFVGAYVAVGAVEACFSDFPRRGVAVFIYVFFSITMLISAIGLFDSEVNSASWQLDLAIVIGAIVTILTVRSRMQNVK